MPTVSNHVSETHVRAAVAQLIEDDSQLAQYEGRHEPRYPFFHPVATYSEHSPNAILGVTRQISPSGIGLLHCAPVVTGRATVTMSNRLGYAVTLPIEVTWCCPCGPHWHLSGGRLLTAPDHSGKTVLNADVPCALKHETELFNDLVASVRQTIASVAERPDYNSYDNRRTEERYYATLPVNAVFEPAATTDMVDRVRMVTRDLSRNGIALISDQAVDEELLTIEISDRSGERTLTALLQVLRCQPLGHLHEIAGRFVTKVYSDEPADCKARRR